MILTDYLRSEKDASWDIARECGVKYGVIRLPDDGKFDFTDEKAFKSLYKKFTDFGFTPIVIEPLPNSLHDHIKAGDSRRDECLDKLIKTFPIMRDLGINTLCFNFMAHIGWLRTSSDIEDRGGAKVTGFSIDDFNEKTPKITAAKLWENYEYFLRAVIPYAEKYDVSLALHPDDPPVEKLGDVERIMISLKNIKRAIYDVYPSKNLGVTFCQANFYTMGEDVYKAIDELNEKIFFVHFRNVTGRKENFRETFHDDGDLDMARLLRYYYEKKIDVPIRVDHVPTLLGENSSVIGYDALGRLFAIGYLKGLTEAIEKERR